METTSHEFDEIMTANFGHESFDEMVRRDYSPMEIRRTDLRVRAAHNVWLARRNAGIAFRGHL